MNACMKSYIYADDTRRFVLIFLSLLYFSDFLFPKKLKSEIVPNISQDEEYFDIDHDHVIQSIKRSIRRCV